MSMLKPFLLFFSGNVSYQTSNMHTTNKTDYNRRGARSFHVKWTSSPGEVDTAKLTEPFIAFTFVTVP